MMAVSSDIVMDLWQSHAGYLGKKSVSGKQYRILELLANVFCPGPFVYYVLDSPTLSFDLVSDSVEGLFACEPEAFSLQFLLDRIHPDDAAFFLRCEDLVAYFLKRCITPEKMVRYKINYCVRLKVASGEYRLFLLQTLTLETSEAGELLKVFGTLTDIQHFCDSNNHQLSFVGLEGEPSLTGVDVFADEPLEKFVPYPFLSEVPEFTRREIDILRLLGAGMSTGEIGRHLRISPQTVVTHRKNILRKSGARNTTELVADCIRKGYI